MSGTNVVDHARVVPAEAEQAMSQKGYYLFPQVLTKDEIQSLRASSQRYFKRAGRRFPGGGKKVANAAVEVPEVNWLFLHDKVLDCFRRALGTDSIMFTSHADVQKDILGGWHKDDGTSDGNSTDSGYFSTFAYDADDCRVYKMGVYLQDHDANAGGLFVREGSHRSKSYTDGREIYLGGRAGDVVLFDVRITHTGEKKTRLQKRLFPTTAGRLRRMINKAASRLRAGYRAALGRERICIFFTFGICNHYTIEFAKSNMLRQIRLQPSTSPVLPDGFRNCCEAKGIELAETHFLNEIAH